MSSRVKSNELPSHQDGGREATVEGYLAGLPSSVRPVLDEVRRILREALPGAEERISYKIPAFRVSDGFVLYYAAWKGHYAVYPVSSDIAAALGGLIEPYLAQKNSLHFKYTDRVPAKLLAQLAKLRLSEVAGKRRVASPARTAMGKPRDKTKAAGTKSTRA